ncbi:MAG: hypothetical protein F4W95_15110 [Chloroflexi bacterium]|nr:hypothetical protein [Chloroflexota bacterium]MYD49787.1 hypothetical protein [Chloroflexota bacterium]
MRKVENVSANAVGRIRKGTDFGRLRVKEVFALQDLMRIMERIDPYCGFNGHPTRQIVVKSFIDVVNEATSAQGPMLDESGFREFIEAHLDHEMLLGYPHWLSESPFPMRPRSHQAPEGECFVVGDSAVISTRLADGILVQQILPIGSKHVFTLTADNFRGKVPMVEESTTLTSETVRSLNAHYCSQQPGRYVYGRNKRVLEQSKSHPLRNAIHGTPRDDYYVELMDKVIALTVQNSFLRSDLAETLMDYPVSRFMMRARALQSLDD